MASSQMASPQMASAQMASAQMTSTLSARHARWLRWIVLGSLVLAGALRMRYAGVHMDLARDMFIAWRTLHGGGVPLSGPVLAGTIHLGPVWYWLLTLLLALGRGWQGAMLLLGLLAGMQYPLAYLAGKELHSRRAGMLWACALLIPSWSTFEWTLPLHYLLSSTCVLAFVLCAARYWRRPQLRYLVGTALAFVLCLHAHPANAGLAWVGLALLVWAMRSGNCRPRDVLIAAAVALLPLLPYLAWDAAHDFADLRAGAHYLGSGEHTGHLRAAGSLLIATASGGAGYWFASMLKWSALAAALATLTIGAVGIIGLAGAAAALRSASTRQLMVVAFGSATAILLTTALLRDMTPYYMTTALRVLLVGIASIGLAALGRRALATSVQALAVAVSVASFAVCATAAAHLQKHGDWPFTFFPLFNVGEAPQPTTPLLLMPAYGVGDSGKFLCALNAPTAHGVLAQYLLHGYAIDMRLACGRSDVKLGGSDADRQHWLGLSRALLARSGVRPERRLGSIALVSAQPQSAGPAIDPPSLPVYPAYQPKPDPGERVVRFALGSKRHIAVSNIAFGFATSPEVAVTLAGRRIEPIAEDAVSRVFACTQCSDADIVEVALKASDLADVDVVTF